MSEVIITGKKTGLKIEEYKGIYSLTSHRESNGQYWAEWAKYKKNKTEYQEKDWPVKVTLGTRVEAVVALNQIIEQISDQQKEADGSEEPMGDCPF